MLNVREIIDVAFQGCRAMHETFDRYFNDSPELSTIKQWRHRGSIPAEWFAAALWILETEAGRPISIEKYFNYRADRCRFSKTKSTNTGAEADVFA